MEKDINLKKIFLICLIISLSISALVGIIIFLFGDFGQMERKILSTTLTIGGFSLTGLCCSILLDKKRFQAFAIFGIIMSVWSFLFATSIIWKIISFDILRDKAIWKTLIISIIITVATAHTSILLLIKSKKTIVNATLITTILFSYFLVLELIILVLIEFRHIDTVWLRILGVFAILVVLGTIITPILTKVTSLHELEENLKKGLHEVIQR